MNRMRVGLLALVLAGAAATVAEAQTPERRARVEVLRRGWLGISYTTTADERMSVDDVVQDSPAGRAGLQVGDTIVRWNGRADAASAAMGARLQPGDTVRLRVRRAGERDRDVAVVVDDRPRTFARVRGSDDVIVFNPGPMIRELRIHVDSLGVHADSLQQRLRVMFRDSLGPRLRELERIRVELPRVAIREREGMPGVYGIEVGARSVAGAEFAELNAGLSEYFGTDRGVVVLRVGPETPAARAGLQAGDVVVRANGYLIERVTDLRQAVSRDEDQTVSLDIVRKGQARKIEMKWE